ncbi:fructose-1,6-bisphosphatase [Catenovulum agarivorans DS-2]|uniref:Fructose-1,6-bisphosphatase class 1 n=1 Tax=Catenovulum agarivorans DS-2 TaxID=1328313 RepID=W7QUJ3_9ALTE|nr:class 1 fructose-bisphosphatase [Catenovulum agarivorans]EWH11533.1 fructose-1,6-bisphosphatase [Catenovulum agarivorans DS-2]
MKRLIPVLRADEVELDLIMLIRTILAATKEISFRVSQGALGGVLGSTLDENIQGETQKKLDVIANQLFKDMLLNEGNVKSFASEEEDTVVAVHDNGKFVVAFDPLDGSSNIDINGQIGTIFTIFPAIDSLAADDEKQFLRKGHEQVAAGYVLYGPSTMLVLSTGKQTRCFTLDRTHGGYLLTHEEMQVPADACEFSINMSNYSKWPQYIQQYIDGLISPKGDGAPEYNMRWNGAMVGDIHRILTRGGIFLYPQNALKQGDTGKLRLLYEAMPMAMLIEGAGGLASSGTQDIMQTRLTQLHQRVPVIMGSKKEVEACLSIC